jgi:hypothetical protein
MGNLVRDTENIIIEGNANKTIMVVTEHIRVLITSAHVTGRLAVATKENVEELCSTIFSVLKLRARKIILSSLGRYRRAPCCADQLRLLNNKEPAHI